jgi:hypothetical protein
MGDFSTINVDEDSDGDRGVNVRIGDDEDCLPPRKRGFEKNIEKLIRYELEGVKMVENAAKMKTKSKECSEQLRVHHENRSYELDIFRSILIRVKGLDYRYCREQLPTFFEPLSFAQIKKFDGIMSRKCKKCNTLKAPQSHHCSTCGHCVARMDHHCPWVNNCVGYANQKFFLQFLIYVFLGSFHAMILIAMKGWGCLDSNCDLFFEPSAGIIAAASIFLALLFGLFVLVMFFDQLTCIIENTSTIDKLQAKRGK